MPSQSMVLRYLYTALEIFKHFFLELIKKKKNEHPLKCVTLSLLATPSLARGRHPDYPAPGV